MTAADKKLRCESEKCRKLFPAEKAVWMELNNRLNIFTEGMVPPKDSQGCFPFCPECARNIRANGGRVDTGEGILVIEAVFSACLHVDRASFLSEGDKARTLVEHLECLIHASRGVNVADPPEGDILDRYRIIEVRNEDDDCIRSACKHCGGEGIDVTEGGKGREYERRVERDGRGKAKACPVCEGEGLLIGRPEEP